MIFVLISDSSAEKKDGLRAKMKEYMSRAEELQKKIDEQKEGMLTYFLYF